MPSDYQQSKERINENARARYKKGDRSEYYEATREERRIRAQKYYQANKEAYRIRERVRDHRTREQRVSILFLDDIKKVYTEANKAGMTVDHIFPLKGINSCGLHVPWNMQIITSRDNDSKSNGMPVGFSVMASMVDSGQEVW